MNGQERDALDHQEALSRFGGKQQRGKKSGKHRTIYEKVVRNKSLPKVFVDQNNRLVSGYHKFSGVVWRSSEPKEKS